MVVVVSLLLAAGCGSSPTSSTPSTPAGPHTIYAVQSGIWNWGLQNGTNESVLEFPVTANGNVSPAASLATPAGVVIQAIAADTSGNLYVASFSPVPQILVYAPGATGAATPARTIAGSNTSLAEVISVAVDPSGQIYVQNATSTNVEVLVFAANATGNVAPIRTITSLYMEAPSGLAVDSSNLYVANRPLGYILVFPSSANGSTTPTRTIGGYVTGSLQQLLLPAADGMGNVYADSQPTTIGANTWYILEFNSTANNTANGNAVPTRTLDLGAGNLLAGFGVDGAGTIYAAILTAGGGYSIEVFGSSASGSATPTAVITSSAWTANEAGIAVN